MMENEEDLKRQLEEAKREKQELEAQLAAEKAKQTRAVYLKVSEKGGASLYGIRRFPITFYVEEWNRILDMEPEIRAFLKAHEGELTTKS
jgi:hypothetical protein